MQRFFETAEFRHPTPHPLADLLSELHDMGVIAVRFQQRDQYFFKYLKSDFWASRNTIEYMVRPRMRRAGRLSGIRYRIYQVKHACPPGPDELCWRLET